MDTNASSIVSKGTSMYNMLSIAISLGILLALLQALRYLSNLGLFDQLMIEETRIAPLIIATVSVEPDVQAGEPTTPTVSPLMAEVATIAGRLGVTDETTTGVEDRTLEASHTAVGRRGQLHGAWDWTSVSSADKLAATDAQHGVVLEHGERADERARDMWAARLGRYASIRVQLVREAHAVVVRLEERDGVARSVLTWRALRRLRAYLRKRDARARAADGDGGRVARGDEETASVRGVLRMFVSPRCRVVMYALFVAASGGAGRDTEERRVDWAGGGEGLTRDLGIVAGGDGDSLRRRRGGVRRE